jgi:hypothetical protein
MRCTGNSQPSAPASGNSVGPPGRRRRGVAAVEAAIVLPVAVILMLGVWEAGRLIQASMTLSAAAREGARLAAGGTSNFTPTTVAMVRQAVRDYLAAAGFPAAAVSGAQIQVVNRSENSWTDPGDAEPLDPFAVTVTIPSGDAFDSLQWVLCTFTGINQLSARAEWCSANDAEVVVSSQLPL